MLKQVLKDAFNAYAFVVLFSISIILAILAMLFVVLNVGFDTTVISGLGQALSLVFIIAFFMATRNEPGLAGTGLALGIIGVVGSLPMKGLGGEQSFVMVTFALSNLLFGIVLLKQEGLSARLLSWGLIILSCFNLWKSLTGYLGTFSASIIFEIIGMCLMILVQVAALYYVISESEIFKTSAPEKQEMGDVTTP